MGRSSVRGFTVSFWWKLVFIHVHKVFNREILSFELMLTANLWENIRYNHLREGLYSYRDSDAKHHSDCHRIELMNSVDHLSGDFTRLPDLVIACDVFEFGPLHPSPNYLIIGSYFDRGIR